MANETWIDWIAKRPEVAGLYWWRVPARDFGGIGLQPEWVADHTPHGMGYEDWQLWPRFSHWDGSTRTVPTGLQWRELGEGKIGDVAWAGMTIGACPFCGHEPSVDWACRANDGGVYVGKSPYQANAFRVHCQGCRLASSSYREDIKNLVEQWNGAAQRAA